MGIKTREIASGLKKLALDLESSEDISDKKGRKASSQYRTKAELTIARAAPIAAGIQYNMVTGRLPYNEGVSRICDSILDRILGRAKQQLDITANEKGIDRLERLAERLQLARGKAVNPITIDVIPNEVHVQTEATEPSRQTALLRHGEAVSEGVAPPATQPAAQCAASVG